MPSDFLNRMSEYRPMLGMRILPQIFASPGLGVHPGTYKVQLLSDTKFLLRKQPTSRQMNWQDANTVIRLIHGEFLWCGVPVSLAAGHQTKKEVKYDLDATLRLLAYQGSGADSTIQIPEGQQAFRHHSQGATIPWSRHDRSR